MKTVSLDLSKQLKEAGYPQEAWWWWNKNQLIVDTTGSYKEICIASPTADEILDVLPVNTIRNWWIKEAGDGSRYYEMVTDYEKITDKSLADAAAQMYLYLKKEGLI